MDGTKGQFLDASRQFDAVTQANMFALAIEYRHAEKNTPPVRSFNLLGPV